jgi:hypothetical protein
MSNLPFPEKILLQHSATLGKTGAGKSSVLRGIFEHQLDHKKRVCIVDPKGDWWGLKSSADGKGAGYPVIAFGDFKEPRATDVPIDEHSGASVAELIATGNRPCIIGFRGWMPAQMLRFWVGTTDKPGFTQTLFNANKGELHVGIDEVHNFAAKGKIMDPDSGRSVHWTNRILGEGRGLGMIFHIASQRSQKVHNDTLDCCETLIAMRVAHPAARKSIEDWINANGDPVFGKEVMSTLSQLKRGEAWIWSPENDFGPKRVQFPMFRTFDSFAPPQLQKTISQSGWSEVDLDQVREKLAKVIAEAKENDPKELQKQIRALKAQLKAQPKAETVTEEKAVARAVKQSTAASAKQIVALKSELEEAMKIIAKINAVGFDVAGVTSKEVHDAMSSAAEKISQLASAKITARHKELEDLKKQASRIEARLRRVLEQKDEPVDLTIDVQKNQPFSVRDKSPVVPPRTVHAVEPSSNGNLSGPQLQILQRLSEFKALGREAVKLPWLAASMGTTVRSRGFEENMRTLKKGGYVEPQPEEKVTLSDAGLAIAGEPETLPMEKVRSRIHQMLSGPQSQYLSLLQDLYPRGVTTEQLAEAFKTTVRARGFEENVRTLRSNELITKTGEEVKCADWMFD